MARLFISLEKNRIFLSDRRLSKYIEFSSILSSSEAIILEHAIENIEVNDRIKKLFNKMFLKIQGNIGKYLKLPKAEEIFITYDVYLHPSLLQSLKGNYYLIPPSVILLSFPTARSIVDGFLIYSSMEYLETMEIHPEYTQIKIKDINTVPYAVAQNIINTFELPQSEIDELIKYIKENMFTDKENNDLLLPVRDAFISINTLNFVIEKYIRNLFHREIFPYLSEKSKLVFAGEFWIGNKSIAKSLFKNVQFINIKTIADASDTFLNYIDKDPIFYNSLVKFFT